MIYKPLMDLKNTQNILGIGCDMCYSPRIKDIYKKFDKKFLKRVYAPAEQIFFRTLPEEKKISFLSKRFAAKEALSKALQTGIGQYAYLTEISCLNDENHAPYIQLSHITHNTAKNIAQKNNFSDYHIYISLSDEELYSLAFIVLVGKNAEKK